MLKKWNDDHVCVGFTLIGTTEDFQKPQCMFCETVFSNASSKPSMDVGRSFSRGHQGIFPKFFQGGPKVVKVAILTQN